MVAIMMGRKSSIVNFLLISFIVAAVIAAFSTRSSAFSFAVIGDIQSDTYSENAFDKSTFIAAMAPDFWIPVGDLVDNSEVASWNNWHQYMAPLELQGTCYPVVGNHDKLGSGGLDLFKQQFPHMTWENEGESLSFTYDDALFIFLKEGVGDDLEWLEDLLQNNTRKWIFIFKHNPLYSTGGGHAVAERNKYKSTTDLLEQYNVNLAFSGHTHMFEIIAPIKNGAITSSYGEGTLYYNTNGFGWAGVADGDMPWSVKVASKEGQNLFTMVTVSETNVIVTTWDIETRTIFDERVLPDRRISPPDSSEVAFSSSTITTSEHIPLSIPVRRSGNSAIPATVDYTTTAGSAIAGLDYIATSGTLNFEPGDTIKTIVIDMVNDSDEETTKEFTVTLSEPTGVTLGSPSEITVFIDDSYLSYLVTLLQILTDNNTAGPRSFYDANGNNKLDLPDILYLLKDIGGLELNK